MKYKFIILLFLAAIGYGYAQKLSQKVGTNPTIIHPSATFELESTTKGFLPPRMSQTEMNAIATPATGLLVYCTNCSPTGLKVYNGSTWAELCTGGGGTSVVANCDTNNGFVGNYYKNISALGSSFSTTITNNSFTTATINFAASDLVLSGVTGFSVGTPTPSSVTLNAGQSQKVTYPITGTPTSIGTLTGNWTKVSLSCSKTQAVGETPCGAYTAAGVFLVFQCYNLGAVENGSPFTPSWQLNGAYIQWGKRGPTTSWGPTTTTTPSWPGAANDGASGFAAAPTASDPNNNGMLSWNTQAAADTAWTSSKNTNDPCPSGYRVPTKNEWASIINANTPWNDVTGASWSNSATNYSSGRTAGSYLYLPAAGYRYGNNGALDWRGTAGWYWSSTSVVSNSASYNLLIQPSYVTAADYGTNNRTNAYSVRCIKE